VTAVAVAGRKPRPYLEVVREGNPGKKRIRTGALVVSGELVEPDWSLPFPVVDPGRRPLPPRPRKAESRERFEQREVEHAEALARWERVREAAAGASWCADRAAQEWDRVVPALRRSAGLDAVDSAVVLDYCTVIARLEWCERMISAQGLLVAGRAGDSVRNPLTIVASQYRQQIRAYIGELGLSPSARTRIDPGRPPPPAGAGSDDDDDGDPFD
jgi:P27 family predicted phage terminase small subunit